MAACRRFRSCACSMCFQLRTRGSQMLSNYRPPRSSTLNDFSSAVDSRRPPRQPTASCLPDGTQPLPSATQLDDCAWRRSHLTVEKTLKLLPIQQGPTDHLGLLAHRFEVPMTALALTMGALSFIRTGPPTDNRLRYSRDSSSHAALFHIFFDVNLNRHCRPDHDRPTRIFCGHDGSLQAACTYGRDVSHRPWLTRG